MSQQLLCRLRGQPVLGQQLAWRFLGRKEDPVGSRREVVLPQAASESVLDSAFQFAVSDFKNIMGNLEKIALR